jgi:hypothetical protein
MQLAKSPIELMRFGTDYKFKIKLREFQITFRPLSTLETVQIEGKVQDHLLEQFKENQRTQLLYSLLFAQKTLQEASTSEPGKTDYQITDFVLSKCTPDEVMYLFNEYNKCVDKVNPSLEKMSAKDLEELVEQAKKKALVMTELSFWQMENLCHALINELAQQGS